MSALIRLDDYGSKKRAILSIQDSYAPEVKDFVAFLDDRGLDITFEALKAYNEHLKGRPAGTRNNRLSAAKHRVRFLKFVS